MLTLWACLHLTVAQTEGQTGTAAQTVMGSQTALGALTVTQARSGWDALDMTGQCEAGDNDLSGHAQ